MPKDLLGREIQVGDYVVFYNLLYEVKMTQGRAFCYIELLEKSKTTRPLKKMASRMCIVSKGAVTNWLLTKDSND